MKIAEVRAVPLAIPLKDPDIPWIWGAFNQVIVELKTDEGLVGYGECYGYGTPLAAASVVNHTLRPLLIGQDAGDIAGLTEALFRKTHLFGRYGVTTFAISGVEIALWDLAGKRAGLPLFELLGGAPSREVKAYASLVRYADRDQMTSHAARAAQEGYEMIKLHQIDVESVCRGREAIGSERPLTVDVNCEWTPQEAAAMARKLSEYDLHWLEEPVWPPEDFSGLARVMRATGMPLASGENACTVHQFKPMVEAHAVAYAQPSVIKVGGIREFLKVATLAETYSVSLAPHSPYFGPGFLATLHLIAHCRSARWIEKLYCELEANVFTRALEFQDATYTLPDGPGLGLDVDPNVLEEYRIEEP